jgi:uncharacterized caspase-like protein
MRQSLIAAAMAAAVGLAGNALAQAQPERRVALVVGNGAYQNVSRLPNAPNDADAMARLLIRLGFEVETVKDQIQRELGLALRRFSRRADGADVAFFFYAGHGLQANDVNYLLPVDTSAERPEDLRFDAVDIGSVLAAMQGARARLLFLDACRNNPLADRLAARSRGVSRGLARIETSEVGILIAFATAPGTTADDGTGSNSPFTAALVENLATPGLEVRATLTRVRNSVMAATGDRQVPWENSSLRSEVYLAGLPTAAASAGPEPAPGAPTAAPRPAAMPAFDPRIVEVTLWQSIQSSTNAADFAEYLRQFPNGSFAVIARNRVAALEATAGQRQAEAERQRQAAEAERQRQADAERQRQAAEAERQRQVQAERQAAEAERQRQAEAERQRRAAEAERQRQADTRQQEQPTAVATVPAARAVTPIDRTLIAVRTTVVRVEAAENAARLGQLTPDTTAQATGRTQSGVQTWYRIAYQGREGWVAGSAAREIDPAEVAAWNRVRESRDEATLEEFSRTYPRGYFAERVRLRLEELRSTAALPAAREPARSAPGVPETPTQRRLPSCQTQGFTVPPLQTFAVSGRTRRNQGCAMSIFGAAELVTPPQHGTVLIENGSVRYQPANNYEGPDVFRVRFIGGGGGFWVSMTVQP